MTIDTGFFQQQLLDQKKTLLQVADSAQEAAATVALDQTTVGRLSRMDAMQAQAMSIETNSRRALELKRIEAALVRLDNGEFGDCLHCGEKIALPRLQADPAATLCIDCAQINESKT